MPEVVLAFKIEALLEAYGYIIDFYSVS